MTLRLDRPHPGPLPLSWLLLALPLWTGCASGDARPSSPEPVEPAAAPVDAQAHPATARAHPGSEGSVHPGGHEAGRGGPHGQGEHASAHPSGADGSHDGHDGHGAHGSPHRFEDAERWAAVFDDPARDRWQRPAEVVRLLELAPGLRVADIGAGTGYFLPHLQRAVGPRGGVLGLDVEPDMVRHMRERIAREQLTGAEASVVGPDDPGLAPGSVDRVLIVNTWHHIANRESYAQKLARALAPGGFVAIVDFTRDASHGPPVQERLPPETVTRELGAAGLVAAPVAETLPDQYVVIGRKPAGGR